MYPSWMTDVIYGECITSEVNFGLYSYGYEARLRNLVTGFMISDESGNRFFPTAVTDYWQDQGCLSAWGPTKTLNIGIIIDVYGGDC